MATVQDKNPRVTEIDRLGKPSIPNKREHRIAWVQLYGHALRFSLPERVENLLRRLKRMSPSLPDMGDYLRGVAESRLRAPPGVFESGLATGYLSSSVKSARSSLTGSGTLFAVEASPAEVTLLATVREVFETNTFGTIAMTRAVIPQFRERKAGVVINVTSSVTLKAVPIIAAYRASKAAVGAFTESMAMELEQFGVRACLVLPGRAPETPGSMTPAGTTVVPVVGKQHLANA
ncbi:SDR family NAD(P)-dependent oxidoreductase [Burkholderia sp. Ac-20365]|uniref:SDR family NAD(P)-dependent oxidoreductase n=1 Tax=Burkholderia sp. Ac-20365 TaxID=2703897 RepID=UPI001F1227B0|nr:SDR family NAD(P)-dependent oxidoreductase [Burkholderia sp. Ac-20365]